MNDPTPDLPSYRTLLAELGYQGVALNEAANLLARTPSSPHLQHLPLEQLLAAAGFTVQPEDENPDEEPAE